MIFPQLSSLALSMLPTKSNRSYSDFFTSGFRAMTNRSRRASALPTLSVTTSDSSPTTRSTRRHSSFVGLKNRRSRTTSMTMSPSESVKSRTSSVRERRDRRSSLVTFSSWLFDHKGPTQADNYLSFSSSPPKNKRELLGTSEITEVWITAGGPFTPTSISKGSDESSLFQPIDPFASSPDSKSFFIDFNESPPPSTRSSKRESFLSFSGSSPDRSFLHLPLRRRECPTSVQTMPLPSRSRRSSYFYRAPSSDRSNYSWTLEEEDSRPATPEPLVEDVEERSDPAQNIDWRQFHVELLLEVA